MDLSLEYVLPCRTLASCFVAERLGRCTLWLYHVCAKRFGISSQGAEEAAFWKSAHRNIGQLLQEVGDVITSKAQSGFYKGLRQSVEEVPKNLFHWPKKRHQRLLPAGNDEDEETKSLQAGLSKFHNGFVYETGLETFQCVQERRGQNNVIP